MLQVQISYVLPHQIIKLLIFIYSYIEIFVEKVTGKMNASILEDSDYTEGMEKMILETINEYSDFTDKTSLWEFLKIRIKNFTIQFCVARARNQNDQAKTLEARINYIDSVLINTEDKQLKKKRQGSKLLLDSLYEKKAKGYQVCSRAAWIELGEKSTKYFLGLETKLLFRQNNNVIHSLKDESGSEKLEGQAILQVARDFYADLYKSDASAREDVDHYLESVTLERSHSDLDKLECKADISYNEC